MDRSSPAPSVETKASAGDRRPGNRPPAARPSDDLTSAVASGPWRTLLAGTSREVLARLIQGDPLGVRAVVGRRLGTESLLLDADRVHLRVIARLARSAGRYRGGPPIAEWVDSHVLETLAEIVAEDHESSRLPPGDAREALGTFDALAAPLGLDPVAMRSACARFNVLSLPERAAFVELVLRGRSLDELVRETGESAPRLAKRARRALDSLLEVVIPPRPSDVPSQDHP